MSFLLNRRQIGAAVLLAGVRTAAAIGKPDAPRFKAKSLSGQMFDNESLKGKTVLVQLWTTWCGYCRKDQPAVDQMLEEFTDSRLVVLAVNAGESRKKVEKYLAENPRKGHVILLSDTNLAAVFPGEGGYPHYTVIDDAGKLTVEQTGAGGARNLYRLLAEAGLKQESR